MPEANTFTDSVRQMRRWSSQARSPKFANTCSVSIPFDGSGTALTVGRTKLWKMGFTGRLVMVEIFGDFITGFATFDLRFGDRGVWPTLAPAYGSGPMPAITIATPYYSGELDLTFYNRHYQYNDVLWAKLVTVSGYTNVSLVLSFKIFEAPGTGMASMSVDGEPLTADGDAVTFRI